MGSYIMKYLSYILLSCLITLSVACSKDKKNSMQEEDIAVESVEEEEAEPEEVFPVYIGQFRMDEYPSVLANKELEYSDIADLPSDELRLLRNAIYAAHNRKFQSEELQDYFSMFSWYSPMYDDYEISLNPTEMANVDFISSYE